MIRVGIVDDQNLVRAGFRMVIDSQADMSVVLEADDGADAVQRLTITPCDVVLMDVRMPVMDGLEATRRITQAGPTPRVIILTTFDLDEYVVTAVQAGASGFLLKDAPAEGMLEALRTVYQGDAVIAPSSTRRLLEQIAHVLPQGEPNKTLPTDLTERELEVLRLMAHGMSNSEIAEMLYVAEATVKTHVSRVLAKTGTRDRVQAVVLAFESGLVGPRSSLGH